MLLYCKRVFYECSVECPNAMKYAIVISITGEWRRGPVKMQERWSVLLCSARILRSTEKQPSTKPNGVLCFAGVWGSRLRVNDEDDIVD